MVDHEGEKKRHQKWYEAGRQHYSVTDGTEVDFRFWRLHSAHHVATLVGTHLHRGALGHFDTSAEVVSIAPRQWKFGRYLVFV